MFIKNNVKFYTLTEVMDKMYDTPKKKKDFEGFYEKYSEEVEREVKLEMGKEIRKAREKKGLSQAEFARRLKTSRPAVSRIESGRQNLTVEYLTKISYALEKPIELRIAD